MSERQVDVVVQESFDPQAIQVREPEKLRELTKRLWISLGDLTDDLDMRAGDVLMAIIATLANAAGLVAVSGKGGHPFEAALELADLRERTVYTVGMALDAVIPFHVGRSERHPEEYGPEQEGEDPVGLQTHRGTAP